MHKIASSGEQSIWDDNPPPALAAIADIYKNNYAALPHQCQFVESAVKTAKIADNLQRDDTRATQYAIGANLIEVVNRLAIKEMVKERERKMLPPYKNEEAIKPRGEIFSRCLLKEIAKIDSKVNELCSKSAEKAEIFERIKELTTNPKLAFRHVMAQKIIDEGDEQSKKRSQMKAPKVTRATGVQKTVAAKGEFPTKLISKMRHWDLLGEELVARGIPEEQNLHKTFTDLKKILQELIGGKEIKSFEPIARPLNIWSNAPECIQKRDQLLKEARKNPLSEPS